MWCILLKKYNLSSEPQYMTGYAALRSMFETLNYRGSKLQSCRKKIRLTYEMKNGMFFNLSYKG